jgi:hypothetical protein
MIPRGLPPARRSPGRWLKDRPRAAPANVPARQDLARRAALTSVATDEATPTPR